MVLNDVSLAAPPRGARLSATGDLSRLLAPRSVAIVGASDKNNMSLCVHTNLVRHGFSGAIHLVNPNQQHVHGQSTVSSLSEIDAPVDLVFSLVGAPRVPALMEDMATHGMGNLVVLSGGFAEEGHDGAELQRQMVEIARRHGQLVLGPNTIGFLNLHHKAVLYGSPLLPPAFPDHPVQAGGIGVVVQSGIMVHAMIRGLLSRRAGLSVAAAVGNEAVVRVHQLIDHLVDDDDTKVIALFIETIRDRDGFRAACLRAAEAGKPIVALRAGRSLLGAATAVSHTGALAGDDAVNAAAFRQLGIIAADSVEELAVTAAQISQHGAPRGKRVAFMAVSGGFCEIFADRAEEVGLELPALAPETVARLRDILPSSAAIANPLDTTGIAQTDLTLFPRAMRVLSEDPGVDAVLVGRNPWRAEPVDADAIVRRFEPWRDAMRDARVPILTVGDSLCDVSAFEQRFCVDAGLPPEIGGLTFGLKAFVRAAGWRHWMATRSAGQASGPVDEISSKADRRSMAEYEVLALLERQGIPVVPWRLARNREEVGNAAAALGFPVAVKVSSAAIAHKSAVGGVVLNVADEQSALAAWDDILSSANALPGRPPIDGVLLMPMRRRGLELILGVRRDPTWGLALVVGLGGVWTEVLRDAAVVPLPASREDVLYLLQSLRGSRLLAGGHGIPPADLNAIVDAALALSALASSLGEELESLELNPVKVDGSRVEALDGLIVWRH